MSEILLAVGVFTAVVVGLSVVVLLARAWLLPQGLARVTVNDAPAFATPAGSRLHAVLADRGIQLPSACGGAGTCGLCRVRVVAGGGSPTPVERDRLSARDLARGVRLACQVPVDADLALRVPAALLAARTRTCRVRSNRRVTPFITELVLELPPDDAFDFRAGAFVQVTAPPYRLPYAELELPAAFERDWDALGLRRLVAASDRPATRAYSLANHPGEAGIAMLDVRLAIPPPGAGAQAPPGVVSSWLFGRHPGDEVAVAGPHGHFFADDGDAEMVFLGGGAGMAPMRAHILEQLEHRHATRRIGFWYGARSRRDLFYVDTFDRLAQAHPNFTWHAALSEPEPQDGWTGPVGFIHQVAHDLYLARHLAPETCEYYLCGPPLMIRATRAMLDDLGVPEDHVHADDFGG